MEDKLLISLGLAPREIKIYKAALKSGNATPAVLAKMTGIKRTTAYSIARGLSEKGLLLEDSSKRPRVFSAASPQDVKSIIAGERARLSAREIIFKELAEELSKTEAGKTYPVPQIRFVREEKMEQFLTDQTAWNESALKSGGTWWGFQDHTYVENFPRLVDSYWKRAPKEIMFKLLSNTSEVERKMRGRYPRREIKFWDKATSFVSTILAIGDYVVMINTRQRPFYLVEIRDATLAHDLREVFKNLWQLVI